MGSKKALQTMEQDLGAATKQAADFAEELTGLVDHASLLGEGKDFAEQLKQSKKKLDTFMVALTGISVKITRGRAPPEHFRAWLV